MSATIIPLHREERPMSNEYDDIPVPERDLEVWKQLDTVDTDAFGAEFFDSLAQDIERAASAPQAEVIPLRSRRPMVLAAVALAAALVLGLGLQLREPTTAPDHIVAITEDATPSIDDIARALGASAMAAVLDGADEDESATLLASREWTTSDDDDLLPTSYGSLLEELDDVDDYDSFFPL